MSMPKRLKAKLGPDVAAIMLTNPNTCGLFEGEIIEIADAVHEAGAYFYCDGANFNAIAGKVRPGDLGIDAMHINLHKTFSTPHGGGGPGAGPVVLSARAGAFRAAAAAGGGRQGLPPDRRSRRRCRKAPSPSAACAPSMARWACSCARSTYMLSHGRDGVRQASEDAVLSANYILASLKDVMSAPFGDGPCMHEALFDDSFLEGTGVTTLDFAKAMIDEGYHPMTMYFPLVVHGAMLIEPTESESKESLDRFIHVLRDTGAGSARPARRARFAGAPRLAPAPPPGRNRGRAQAGAALEARSGEGRGGIGAWALTSTATSIRAKRSSIRPAFTPSSMPRRAGFILLGIGLGTFGSRLPPAWWCWRLGVLLLAAAWVRQWASEFAVTDRRVIIKVGFISRRTIEINMSKVESDRGQPGHSGRLFNYGTILVIGTGGTKEPFALINDPLAFRRAVQSQQA